MKYLITTTYRALFVTLINPPLTLLASTLLACSAMLERLATGVECIRLGFTPSISSEAFRELLDTATPDERKRLIAILQKYGHLDP
jgi:hypothetical protein